eukprot:g17574.t1
MKGFVAAVLAVLATTVSLFPWTAQAAMVEVLFGQTAPFSGPNKELGEDMRNGLMAAFKEYNDAQQSRYKLSLISLDDGYEPGVALNNTMRLVQEEKVFAIVGCVGTPTAQKTFPYLESRH